MDRSHRPEEWASLKEAQLGSAQRRPLSGHDPHPAAANLPRAIKRATEALRVALAREAYLSPHTAADERGGKYIIWTERVEIFFAYRPAGGSWGLRAVVVKSRYPLFLDPALTIDRHGNVYVA